jgi:hypothetical protein
MAAMILRFLLACFGSLLACVVVGVGILYSAWWMSRRDNGWDR